jgi:hypothetical protein
MSDTPGEGLAHLRPMESELVDNLCDRAVAASPDSYAVRLEIEGFRRSRTPWDAMRLANALAYRGAESDATKALVLDLDSLAHERAALVPAGGRPVNGSARCG